MSIAYIGFSKPNKWMIGAEAIKWWMSTDYCHVYLRVYSRYTQQWLVYHASHGMVHMLLWDNFCANNIVVKEFQVDVHNTDLQNTVKKAQSLLGQPYGYIGLLKLVLRKVCPKLVRGDDLASFHCSEFIAVLFPQLAQNIDEDYIEPVHLFEALQRQVG